MGKDRGTWAERATRLDREAGRSDLLPLRTPWSTRRPGSGVSHPETSWCAAYAMVSPSDHVFGHVHRVSVRIRSLPSGVCQTRRRSGKQRRGSSRSHPTGLPADHWSASSIWRGQLQMKEEEHTVRGKHVVTPRSFQTTSLRIHHACWASDAGRGTDGPELCGPPRSGAFRAALSVAPSDGVSASQGRACETLLTSYIHLSSLSGSRQGQVTSAAPLTSPNQLFTTDGRAKNGGGIPGCHD